MPWGGAATRSHVGELESAIEKTRGLKGFQENKQESSNKPAMENVADPPPPVPAANVNAEINDIRIATRGLQEEGSVLGQEKQEKLGAEESLLVDLQGAQPGNILGAQIMPDTARSEVTGTVVTERPGWRLVRVSDDPSNGELAGKQIGYATKDEPGVRPGEVPGTGIFGVPQGHWSEYYNKELSSAAGDLVPTGEFDAGRALTEADQALDAAKSGADMQGAIVKMNGVREHYGMPALDDVELQRVMEERKVGDTRAGIKSAVNDTRRWIEAEAEAANVDKMVAERARLERELEGAPNEVRAELEAQIDDLSIRIGKQDEPTTAKPPTTDDLVKVGSVPPETSVETAPLNQVVMSKLARITRKTPFKNDRAMMFDFLRRGQQPFMEKYGLDADGFDRWVAQEHVAGWVGKLGETVERQKTPPTKKIEQEKVFAPEDEVGMEFVRKAGTNGRELAESLRQSQDPVLRALAEDLGRHEAALGVIDVSVRDMDGTSYVRREKDGRQSLKLTSSLRHADPGDVERIMMHELLHGLTLRELHEPTNAGHVTALDGLRQKVIETLPKNLRGVLDDMQKGGWYDQWDAGAAKWDDYKDRLDNVDDMHTLYGLLNNDEFISQGLTVPEFREKLAGIKGADGVNLYTKFVDWIKNVLGLRAEGSVLEQLMHHTDELIGTGNYMATTREYGQRYFENQGMSPKQATKHTERAMALIRGGDADALTRMVQAQVDTPELVRATKGMRQALQKDPGPTHAVLTELRYPPTEKGLDQFANDLVLGKAEGAGDALRVMDPKVAAYVYAKARDLQSLLGMVNDVTKPGVADKVTISEPARVRAFAVEHLDNVNKALDNEHQFVKDTADLQGMEAISPMGLLDAEMKRRAPGVHDPPDVDTPAKKLTMMEKIFATPTYLAKVSAEAAEFVSRGHMLESNMKKMKLGALQALGLDEQGKFSREQLRTFSDPQVQRAASRWLYQNYQKGKESGITMLGRDDADVRRELTAVPEAKRRAGSRMSS